MILCVVLTGMYMSTVAPIDLTGSRIVSDEYNIDINIRNLQLPRLLVRFAELRSHLAALQVLPIHVNIVSMWYAIAM